MEFSQAVEYLSDAGSYGIVPGLDSITRLMKKLSDPQDRLKFIHIAGTNGKGSTGTFLNSILMDAGYKTGRFVSPAVMDYLEIIQFDKKNISKEDFSFYISKVKAAADQIISEGFPHPTVFELQTAAAFCFFADKNCDIVLLEVGMGGENDATNIIKNSIVSVITSISTDHTQFLGNTIEEIAMQKAGIIKRNGNVVTISQNPKVINIIRHVCNQKSAYIKISKIYNICDCRYENGLQYFSYNDYKDICLKMLGKYQTENAALAIDTCKILNDCGYNISKSNIYSGLKNSQWPGRFEIVKKDKPVFIIDGAHNESAAVRLREAIDICFSDCKITYIIGMFKDKNYEDTVRITAKRAQKIYTVTPDGNRGLDAAILSESIRPYNINVITARSINDAVESSLHDDTDVILAFGSLSFLNQIRKYICKEDNNEQQI